MMSPTSPIVVLDSGLGGLTVVRALRSRLPHEQILYFGDTARLPYGSKSAATVTTFVRQIIGFFAPQEPKHIVIACNTATALALPGVRAEFPGLAISGVVEPGARAAVSAAGAKNMPMIGVIATEATIKSRAYERAILRRRQHARLLLRPTPLIVPLIEEGRAADDPVVTLALEQYLRPMVQRGLDVLVLGCTHYPILKDAIVQIVGGKVRVIDSAEQCAEDVARRLQAAGLLSGSRHRSSTTTTTSSSSSTIAVASESGATDDAGTLKCFVTDDPSRFRKLGTRFLGLPIDPPTWVSPDDLYAAPNGASAELRQAV